MTKYTPIEQRFWNRLDYSGECWIWTGSKKSDGYGAVEVNRKSMSAHRIAYELTYGPIPKGMLVCHHCDNPSCCNPSHLFLGTYKDNRLDCVRKGREGHEGGAPPGHKPASTKLTSDQVLEIRKLHGEGIGLKRLAFLYEVDRTQIWHITARRQWKNI